MNSAYLIRAYATPVLKEMAKAQQREADELQRQAALAQSRAQRMRSELRRRKKDE